jgi:alginate O-acetyltransferase complex protein AlgI
MLFQSWPFALFFLVVYAGYLILKKTRLDLLWLLAASWFFYGWLNPLYVLLVVYTSLADFIITAQMEKSSRPKLWLCASIISNIGLLGFFKYAGFITENINNILSLLGSNYTIDKPGFLLPVGISFYTFQSLSYVIDCCKGNTEREKSFIRYALFLSFFPRILAGPIERASGLLTQLRQKPALTMEDITDGLSLFVTGLFKKIALADYLAIYVNKVYDAPKHYQSPALILATFLYCWQIYFDFSGYTDMARGVARMFGFRLMLNFNNPYLATSLGDFWNRWHISMSSWFKDYLYIPLGGNRKGTLATYRNILLTMVISGLWHGAAWTFVIWGLVHATGRLITRELERTSFYKDKIPKFVKQIFVLCFVCFAWIFFRATSIAEAGTIVGRIFTSGYANPQCPVIALIMIVAAWAYQFMYESRLRLILELRVVRIIIVVGMILYMVLFASASQEGFIYQQF